MSKYRVKFVNGDIFDIECNDEKNFIEDNILLGLYGYDKRKIFINLDNVMYYLRANG